ncbi:MAG: pyridoxal phosphate-dependent aminotransferase [Deltaproteobacteria bacterium]|nr:MAG: pyridoxal phosphate-dependent aminotransferase [Deltaproteobacteria bacterium]
MPRHPDISPVIAAMPRGVFSSVAHRIAGLRGEVYPLHIGDTWLEPPEGCRLEDLRTEQHPGIHRYGRPRGRPELIAAIAARHGVSEDRVLVSTGATGALGAALGALLDPGDEVLVLAPFWPLIRGIVTSQRGVPVEVPYYVDPPGHRGTPLGERSVEERLAPWLTTRTVAIYLNSPNNPSGVVLPAAELAELAAFARRHGLWLLSDEVYEQLSWTGPPRSIREFAPERTFSACSFSKAWAMAGNRVGYLLGPEVPEIVEEVRKVAMHGWYAAPNGPQVAAVRVLSGDCDGWLQAARAHYREAALRAAELLGMPAPDGGTFLLVDVSHRIDERGMQGFLEDCIDRRLLVAPGASCGQAYADTVRVCFTSAPLSVVEEGLGVLAELLR